jgi:Fic family protein
MLTTRQKLILNNIASAHPIQGGILKKNLDLSQATLNRELKILLEHNWIIKSGNGRSTAYKTSSKYKYLRPVDLEHYYQKDLDHRQVQETFNFEIFDRLAAIDLFTTDEILTLNKAQSVYLNKIQQASPTILQKEWERFTIELSWKSAQIEGNTYDLLETEALFKYQEKAPKKSDQEASMLLNHKKALGYLKKNHADFFELSTPLIEYLHRLLIQNLGVSFNVRNAVVGITGSRYRPLDNAFQIREALDNLCQIINQKNNIFEKSLLTVLGISYLQPFEDGNKRTARILANALLMAQNSCPLSYRSVSATEYKKALLVFYETNNLSAFKDIFIQQYVFASKNYF